LFGETEEVRPITTIDTVSLTLTVAAIALAIQQFFDARKSKKHEVALDAEVAAQRKEILIIKGQTTTRAIPRFPDNVPPICKLIDACTPNTTLEIMVDYIGYSLYSDRAGFDIYIESIRKALDRGVRIQILVYDYTRAKRALRKQYPSISEEKSKARFADLFKQLGVQMATNEKEFYRALFQKEEDLYKKIARAEMKLLAEDPPALFWLKDNPRSIIFSFRDEFPGTGFSFESEDSNLVAQFEAMFKAHWGRAEEHWDCRW
jgi:hypothetical protein